MWFKLRTDLFVLTERPIAQAAKCGRGKPAAPLRTQAAFGLLRSAEPWAQPSPSFFSSPSLSSWASCGLRRVGNKRQKQIRPLLAAGPADEPGRGAGRASPTRFAAELGCARARLRRRLHRPGPSGAQASRSRPCAQAMRRIDQRQMRNPGGSRQEGRDCADHIPQPGAPRRCAARAAARARACLIVAPEQHITVDQPEAAGEKPPSPGGRPSNRAAGVVAQDRSVANELAFDGGDGALDARIVGRQEPDDGDEQATGVQRRTAGGIPMERVLLGIEPGASLHTLLRSNSGLHARPLEVGRAPSLDRVHRGVERDPRHHLQRAKRRGLLRTSHMGSSGSAKRLPRRQTSANSSAPCLPAAERPARRATPKASSTSPTDVESKPLTAPLPFWTGVRAIEQPVARELHLGAVARPLDRRISAGCPGAPQSAQSHSCHAFASLRMRA